MMDRTPWSLLSTANVKDLEDITRPYTLNSESLNLSKAATDRDRHHAALLIFAYLSQHRHHELQPTDETMRSLIDQITSSLLPPLDSHAGNDYALHSLTAELGLASLDLIAGQLGAGDELDDDVFIRVVAYTDSRDPWTSDQGARIVSRLMSSHLCGKKLACFITGPLLHGHFRPLFSNSPRLTASGRPSQYPYEVQNQQQQFRLGEPPVWKERCSQTMTMFNWAVEAADDTLITEHWPLFIPVLVALIEDGDMSVRERGLEILVLFLTKCPADVLLSTGIGSIFEEAVFPTLMFLPTLTPEDESIRLLRLAYRALLLLAGVDHGCDNYNQRTRRLLDRILREGVLAGYHHASENIRLVQVFLETAAAIVDGLGIFCVKHLEGLLQMFSSVLMDPFAMAHAQTVAAAVNALNITLANSWPRMSTGTHVEHIVYILAICWLNLPEKDTGGGLPRHELQMIRQQLRITSSFLESVWAQPGMGVPSQLLEAFKQDPSLVALFPDLQVR